MGFLDEADYYARKGLEEAEMQNDHRCDGDFYKVQQAVLVLRGRPPMKFS
jgi:hypothetical protein